MFEYEGGVEIESEGGDDVQLDGNRREDAGCRVGPRDWWNLHVFLLECLVSHFFTKVGYCCGCCCFCCGKASASPPKRQYLIFSSQVCFFKKTTKLKVLDTASLI